MTVKFYVAIGENDFEEVMYNAFCDKIGEGNHPYPSGQTIMVYDINDVAVIHTTRKDSNLGRNCLRMIGVEKRFERAKSEIEKKTGFRLEEDKT